MVTAGCPYGGLGLGKLEEHIQMRKVNWERGRTKGTMEWGGEEGKKRTEEEMEARLLQVKTGRRIEGRRGMGGENQGSDSLP